ncbi:MAG: Na/Pi cotransporter family protein [Erysipelotrichaceae bacterium]|nr:Na/Pi cotransporter family protein [Erysipelotrichaceae bacterium]
MDIYSVLQLLAGLAFFLYGMSVMSSSLEKMAGGSLELTLKKVTSNKLLSFLLGAIITIAIQSSSGVMVMLVGLVNSNIIEFKDTLAIILGSNVGTTITGWILTLTGIESSSFSIMSVLNPKFFTPLLALAGVIMRMVAKKDKQKDLGTIFVGFAVLMYGMTFMSDSMKQMASEPWFANILVMFKNPILAVLVATVFTAVIQSSAAAIGIIEAFALSGQITLGMAIPLVLGANIGTCVTGLISAIGVAKNAKRVSVLQVVVNCSGAILVLVVLLIVGKLPVLQNPTNHVQVALVHTIFNILVTIVAFTAEPLVIKAVKTIVRDDPSDLPKILIDERLLARPSVAVNECMSDTIVMGLMVQENLKKAMSLLDQYDEKVCQEVKDGEDKIDWYDDELETYLVKLSKVGLSEEASESVNKMLHVLTDFERIGDHALNIAQNAEVIHRKKMAFSPEAKKELTIIINAVSEIVQFALDSFNNNDLASAAQVEPLEEVIDDLTVVIKDAHIRRLVNGECTIELGIMLSDLLTDFERISDHCSNVAVCIIEVNDEEFYVHQYLTDLKHDSEAFKTLYHYYKDKYEVNSI